MSYFQARLAEVQIPPKKPQKYLFHVPRTNLNGFLIQFIKNPFVLFLASIVLDLSMFFKTEGAAIVSAAAA